MSEFNDNQDWHVEEGWQAFSFIDLDTGAHTCGQFSSPFECYEFAEEQDVTLFTIEEYTCYE